MDLNEKTSLPYYTIALVGADQRVLGNLHGRPESDVKLKTTCRENGLGPYFEVKLTVAAPAHMKLRGDRYNIYSKLYPSNITNFEITQVIEQELHSVAKFGRGTHKFDETVQEVSSGNKQGVVRFEFDYNRDGSTHEGLYNTLSFTGYVDRETDEELCKPWVGKAIAKMRTLFESSGRITFYIRNEECRFEDAFTALYSKMQIVRKDGPLISKFYSKSSATFSNNLLSPYPQLGQVKGLHERPSVTTGMTYIHADIIDFCTRKGFASIQSLEYEQAEVDEFNSTTASIKLLSFLGSGNQMYTGILTLDSDVEKRLIKGDKMSISFNLPQKEIFTSLSWRAEVIAPMPWLQPGEVACLVSRPRQAASQDASDAGKKSFIPGHLPCGDGVTNNQLRNELDKQHPIAVRLYLEHAGTTYRRHVYAFNLLARGARLVDSDITAFNGGWEERPVLHQWQERYLNQVQIPATYTDILKGAAAYLDHLTDPDHIRAKNYLQHVPTLNDIALGIVQGRAGAGKTAFMASTIAALLRNNPDEKVIVGTPSNEPANVAARKIYDECRQFPETADLLIIRCHTMVTEKNYTAAYGKLAAMNMKRAENQQKTTEQLVAEEHRNNLKHAKHVRDQIAALAKRQSALDTLRAKLAAAQLAPNYSILHSQTALTKFEREPTVSNSQSGSDTGSQHGDDNGHCDQFGEQYMDINAMVHFFNEAVVVSDGCFNEHGGIDIDRLDRDLTLGKAEAGVLLARHMSTYMAPGDKLMHDPRFQEIKQSLGWTILIVAGGLVPDVNRFTDPARWAEFRELFQQYMEHGDSMDSNDRSNLDDHLKKLRAYCVSHSSVLVSTMNNFATRFYYQNFAVSTMFLDDMNRGLLNDMVIMTTHYEPTKVILIGDLKQQEPVVIGPKPLTGFLPELQVSALSYFLSPSWPSTILDVQRRSRTGIMDIPTLRYYNSEVVNGVDAESDLAHPFTFPFTKLVDQIVPDVEAVSGPVTYIEITGSLAVLDHATRSRFNLQQASFIINFLEHAVASGIHPKNIGIVTPYMSQVMIYTYARNQLRAEFPTAGYEHLLVGTSDSMEGDERPIILMDPVITHEAGFVNNPKQALVNLTRARDGMLVIGNTPSIFKKHGENEIIRIFDMAKSDTRKICRQIPASHAFLKHRYVDATSTRVRS